MKNQDSYRLMRVLTPSILIVIGLASCSAPPIAATQPPASFAPSEPAAVVESPATSALTSLPEASPTGADVANPQPTTASPGGVQYQDDFTNVGTQWPEATLGDYHVGYHEPEWYEVEVKSANSKVPVVPVPDRKTYGDATIELEVNTFAKKTAPEGDFRYGFVFRRSGDLWYGFFISPTAKHWYVIKNTSAGQQTLADGPADNLHSRDINDTLRVDALGASFLFHINGQLVKQVADSDYASGEVGLYVESLDSLQTHIHFDKLTIAEVNVPLACTIDEGSTKNVRAGPGKNFPMVSVLNSGDTVKAEGKTSSLWIKILVEGSDQPGWVSFSDGYITCTPDIDLFPLVTAP